MFLCISITICQWTLELRTVQAIAKRLVKAGINPQILGRVLNAGFLSRKTCHWTHAAALLRELWVNTISKALKSVKSPKGSWVAAVI